MGALQAGWHRRLGVLDREAAHSQSARVEDAEEAVGSDGRARDEYISRGGGIAANCDQMGSCLIRQRDRTRDAVCSVSNLIQ